MRMSAVQRRVARLATMATVIGLIVWGAGFLRARAQAGAAPSAKPAAKQAGASAAVAARGKYLVDIAGCHDCHTPHKMGPDGPEPDMSLMLSGHPASMTLPPPPPMSGPWLFAGIGPFTAWAGPWGISYTRNLTPDRETGLGSWTEQQFVETIRNGRQQGRGRQLLPPMPWPAYRNMTDADLKAKLGLAVTGKLEATAAADANWYLEFVNSIPGLAPLIESQQQALTRNATSLGLVGIVTVLWTASTLTNRAQRALGIVFGAPRRVIANRFRALGVTIGLGVTLIATLAVTGLIVGLHVEGLLSFPLKVVSFLVLLVLDIGYFTLAYWALTPMREIPLREHLAGGILMAVGWTILSFVGVYLVDRSISHASALYGTLGTVFGLLLFIRLAMWLFLYGAEVTSLVHRIRLGDETGAGASRVRG